MPGRWGTKQEKVVDLETNGQEDIDGERVAEAVARPVVGSGCVVKLRHQHDGPDPPRSL